MPKTGSSGRRMWTNQEKEQLIIGFEDIPLDQRAKWLRSKKVDDGWFYRMRLKYFAEHPEFGTEAEAQPGPPQATSIPFSKRTREEKLQLVREYKALPSDEVKRAWREQYQISNHSGILTYWSRRLPELPTATLATSSTPNGSPVNTDRMALVAEYEKLSHGDKGAWLQEHQIDRKQMYDWKYGFGSRRSKLSKKLSLTPHPPQQLLPPPVKHILSVDDMINAFKVERDMLNEVITKMERMRSSH